MFIELGLDAEQHMQNNIDKLKVLLRIYINLTTIRYIFKKKSYKVI